MTAEAEGGVSHARVRELSDAHPRDITLKFQELVRHGLLDSFGHTRNMTYASGEPEGLPLLDRGSTPAASDATSEAYDHTSASSDATSASSDATSASSDATSALARLRQTQRARRTLVNAAILEYCAGRYRTYREIADAISRTPPTVKNRYIPALVQDGWLEMRYPETPNHPGQAYRTRRVPNGGKA